MFNRAAVTLLLGSLVACAPQDDALPLLADAGPSTDGDRNQPIALDGSSSTGDLYAWSFARVPEGSALTDEDLVGGDTPLLEFVPDVDGLYVFNLDVCDLAGRCVTDQGVAQVGEAYKPFSTQASRDQITLGIRNHTPRAMGTVRRARPVGVEVLMDGSQSWDLDGDPLSFRWVFVTLPSQSDLDEGHIYGQTAETASFDADVPGLYELKLEVSDGRSVDSYVLAPITLSEKCWDDWDPIPNFSLHH